MPRHTMHSPGKTSLATAAALVCFAGNSILCRFALGHGSIDAWSYTFVRLASGALTLFVLVRAVSGKSARPSGGSFGSAFALFAYAIAFSLAYLRVGAGVGALVLFASVQATMIGWSVREGARPSALEWLGLGIAMGGLALLTLRGSVSIDPIGIGLMM
ncbi:MAG: EamA family transporter, partial [Steroidobacteraceae bacterium]